MPAEIIKKVRLEDVTLVISVDDHPSAEFVPMVEHPNSWLAMRSGDKSGTLYRIPKAGFKSEDGKKYEYKHKEYPYVTAMA